MLKERDLKLEARVERLYDADLPYHNFQHVNDTLAAAHDIIARCNEEGVPVNAQVVYLALLFHDAGYRDDHERLGYPSKERYSAVLAESLLSEYGIERSVIDMVMAAIESTHRDASFSSIEQKAVRAADLSGLAADYEKFRHHTEELRQEHHLLTGESIAWNEWVAQSSAVVRFYLDQELTLSSYFYSGDDESSFHQRIRANVERLAEDLD
jgi:predicted metal-dependent HD superfamily phosphohydrolase